MGEERNTVLGTLDEVFTTRQYRAAAGTGDRGVPTRLRKAEQQNRVVNIKPGVWAKARPGRWDTPIVDPVVLLRALYGDRPVRLSYRAALGPIPATGETVAAVTAPYPVSNSRRLRRWGIVQYREPETTFRLFSEPLGGNVWRSTRPRALLETARHPGRVYDPTVVMAYGMDAVADPPRVMEVANALGWATGLRRLQSVASELRNHWQYETLGIRIDKGFCGMLPSRSCRWIHLKGAGRSPWGRTVEYADFENRVWWDTIPDVTVESFLW